MWKRILFLMTTCVVGNTTCSEYRTDDGERCKHWHLSDFRYQYWRIPFTWIHFPFSCVYKDVDLGFLEKNREKAHFKFSAYLVRDTNLAYCYAMDRKNNVFYTAVIDTNDIKRLNITKILRDPPSVFSWGDMFFIFFNNLFRFWLEESSRRR